MALRVAVANGNWSNPAIWNGGVLPNPGDIVASNTFTVTIDVDINVDSITNAARAIVDAVPDMTSNTSPSGIVSASDIPNPSTNDAFRAFDNSSSTWWSGGTVNVSNPRWISYQFPNAIPINQYVIQGVNNGNEQGPKDWEFQGWNGSNWVTLHTVTGHNSNAYTSPLIGNSTLYSSYRLLITASLSISIGVVNIILYEYSGTSPAVAGGGFILNDGLTVTCTGSGVVTGTTTCLTYSGSGVCTINANIFPANASTNEGVSGLIYSGSGTLNLNGNINNIGLSIGRGPTVLFSGTGTLNVNGNINALQVRQALRITNTSVCNIVGNLNPGNAAVAVQVTGNAVVNITGNIFPQEGGSGGASLLLISAAAAVVTVTGNVYPDTTFFQNAHGISVTGSSQLYIIGTINGGSGSVYNTVISTSNCFISVIGSIKSQRGVPAFYSTGAGAINILTGPFISGDSGAQPLFVTRMHYQRTMGSYYEFRDNSTLGALPPSAPAPATRLVSPDTVADSPVPRDVRLGTIYAEGSQTGTMIVPSRDNVAKGVLVDNTVGTAILDADSIWAVPLTSINTLNSIGRRVKNAATVETTGAQIQQTLNDNE